MFYRLIDFQFFTHYKQMYWKSAVQFENYLSLLVTLLVRLATSVRALAHTPLRKRAWGPRFEPDGGWFRDL